MGIGAQICGHRVRARLGAAAMLLAALAIVRPAAAANPPSRPILFVHGFCGSGQDFAPLVEPLYTQMNRALYPAPTLYYVLYNARSNTVTFFAANGTQVNESAILSNTRFFSMELYDPVGETTDSTDVAKISILNKAYEIEQAIEQITAITHIKDVIVLAHSLGGLDARAYIENLASAGACYDYQANTPDFTVNTCTPGAGDAKYGGDVGDLITLDTPHSGTPLDTMNLTADASYIGTCLADTSVDRAEMNPMATGGPGLLEALNFAGSLTGGEAATENTAPIQAVEDYFSDVTDPWIAFYDHAFTGYDDDLVELTSQSIANNLPAADTTAKLVDVPVGYASDSDEIVSINYSTGGCEVTVPFLGTTLTQPMMHPMSCLGALPDTQNALAAQINANTAGVLTSIAIDAKLNGKPWTGTLSYKLAGPAGAITGTKVPANVTDLALGSYSLSFVSGGPVVAHAPVIAVAPSATLERGQWSATFTVAFSGAILSPKATTGAASAITADGATLKGTVNPADQAGQALFQWGTTAKLAAPKLTCTADALKNCPAVKANTTAQPFTAKITTAKKKTKIYYRIAFYNPAKRAYTYGAIASFTTLK